jgi:hypothetical protein
MRWWTWTLASLALFLALCTARPGQAEGSVDLALVLAVDVSYSMDPDEQALQREGYIEAFRSSLVHRAIAEGALGRIAVTYVEWASASDQQVVIPWMNINGAEAAFEFADRLARIPTRRGYRTSISAAVDFSAGLFAELNVEPARRVIDISGDGPNNQGRSITAARDEALARGIAINGLPIMLKRPSGPADIENLDIYYRDCVIGGPGAFMVPVREREQFIPATTAKLIREVADSPSLRHFVQPAQGSRMDCSAGELKWMQGGSGN